MKRMIIIIIVLAIILISMICYKNVMVATKNNVNIEEIGNIEKYISKIYMWKEITNEALPVFDDVNNSDDLWVWEVIKKNLEKYNVTYEEIEAKSKEIFGEDFNKKFPIEGNQSFEYNDISKKYLATESLLDKDEDEFLLNNIIKTNDGYTIEIVEYIEDYAEENKVIIRNSQEEEIGQVGINDSETKMQEIVKNNIDRFSKKRISLKSKNKQLTVQKVERIQE